MTVVLITLVSCEGVNSEEKALLSKVHEIREQYAPDKRTVLFDIRVFSDAKKYILTGETDNEIALAELRKSLESSDVEYIDKIKLLPSDELEGKTQAIVNISVANLRSNAKHSAELATQATLGTPVKVLKKEGGWYYIQTPDKYLSWVDDGGIQLMNDDDEQFDDALNVNCQTNCSEQQQQ